MDNCELQCLECDCYITTEQAEKTICVWGFGECSNLCDNCIKNGIVYITEEDINMFKKGGSMTISKDEFSWTVKHKHFYRVVLACAEIVFRIKYPFLPTRSDFLTRKVNI